MIISVNTRQASVVRDEPTAVVESLATRVRRVDVPTSSLPTRSVRATVEILRSAGGLMPRALVGGTFASDTGSQLVVEVATTGPAVSGEPTCASRLAKPLVAGLPDEFASSVLDGLSRRAPRGGRLVVDRAGFDPVESSSLAFELAAELLAVVLGAEDAGTDVMRAARAALEAWP